MGYVFVEDHVVPQIFTSAIEAYEFLHNNLKGKGANRLETFGLLWGYSVQAKGNQPDKIIVTMATIETSATRHSDWVKPDFESLLMKKEFLESYWPDVELVGTFHSHPYSNLRAVRAVSGWQASQGHGDAAFFPHFHKEIATNQKHLAHLIVTITHLQRVRNSPPARLPGNEAKKGYILSAGKRRIWLRAYGTTFTKAKNNYQFIDESYLEIPSLQPRFQQ
jgi:hypothetical protein